MNDQNKPGNSYVESLRKRVADNDSTQQYLPEFRALVTSVKHEAAALELLIKDDEFSILRPDGEFAIVHALTVRKLSNIGLVAIKDGAIEVTMICRCLIELIFVAIKLRSVAASSGVQAELIGGLEAAALSSSEFGLTLQLLGLTLPRE